MRYSWILFDADGTLFDYDRAEHAALAGTFKSFDSKFDAAYIEVYHRINKQLWLEFERGEISAELLKVKRFDTLLSKLNMQIDAANFSTTYLKKLSQNTDLLDGAENLLKRLKRDFKLLMVTNGLKEVQRPRFNRSSIGIYFSDFVISGEIGVAKPDTRFFEYAFTKMNFPTKSEVIIIGDNLSSDIKGGKNYGIDTCWFNPKKLSSEPEIIPTYEIDHLSEIEGVLDRN